LFYGLYNSLRFFELDLGTPKTGHPHRNPLRLPGAVTHLDVLGKPQWRNVLKLVGGFNPSEKYYSSHLGLLFSIYGKIKNVPNHQPESDWILETKVV